MASILNRLRRRVASAAKRGRTRAVGARARIDTSWLLTDESLCVDGWYVEPGRNPGPIEARVVQGARVGPWSPLLRKDRLDVVEHILGSGAPAQAYGVVGQVLGPVDVSSALWVELRGAFGSTRVPVDALRRDAVPEEVFAGLVVTEPMTPASLAPVIGVVRASPLVPIPPATVAYRHHSFTGTAPVSVVVPVYENFTYLRNLLRAVAGGHDGIELSIVVDDPDLTRALTAWIRGWNDSVFDVPVQVLAHASNAGFAAACNTGWRSTASEVVLLLNSDVLVGAAERDIRRLAAGLTSGVTAVAPILLFPDGTLQHAGMEMVDAPDFPGFVLPGHPGKHGPADGLPTEPFSVQMLTGAAFCVRRTDLEAIGGVPAVFGRGDFEDVLASLALRVRGRLVVDPDVRWMHLEGASYRRETLGGVAVTLAKSVVAGERAAAILDEAGAR